MPAFAVFTREETLDAAELAQYSKMAPATLAGHQVRPLAAYGAIEVMEGEPIEGAVILGFPSVAEAKAWYNSPAYQEAVQHRFAGARYRMFIIEGVG